MCTPVVSTHLSGWWVRALTDQGTEHPALRLSQNAGTSIAWLCILNPLEIACGLRRLLLQVPSQHLVVPRPRVCHGCEASPGVDLHLATAKDATRAVGGAFIGQSRLLPSGFALLHSCGSFSGKLPCGQPFQLGFSKMSNLIYCHLM